MQIANEPVTGECAAPAAVFDCGHDRLVTAAINRCSAAIQVLAALRLDVDDSGGAIAVLGGQHAGDQRYGIEEFRRKLLPETGKPVGKKHAVDAILKVGFLASHMKTFVEFVLRHAGKTIEGLVERCELSL